MDAINLPNKLPGIPHTTKSQPPTTLTKGIYIRLTITPSPSKSSSPSLSSNMPATGGTSAVFTTPQRKEPAPKKVLSMSTKRSITPKKAWNAPNRLTAPPKMSPTENNAPSTTKKVSAAQNKVVTGPTKPSTRLPKSPIPKRASPTPANLSNTPKDAVTPTKKLSTPRKFPTASQAIATPTPSISRENVSPYVETDSPSPAPTAKPATPPPKSGPSLNKRAINSIPKNQILCCRAIRPTSKAEKEGHDDLVTFVKSFCGKEVESVSSIKNVYGVIWQEYNFVIGINVYNPNNKTLEVKFYGGEEFSKGKVVEIAPQTRPAVLTPLDAEVANEECLIRMDCGIDFNCKSHRYWRLTAFFLKWQAPGEKDRWERQHERLRKRKRSSGSFSMVHHRVLTTNELGNIGRLERQINGADDHMGEVEDGGYVFSEDLFSRFGSSGASEWRGIDG